MWIPEVDDRANNTWETENDVVFEARADGPTFRCVLDEDVGSERRRAAMLGRELGAGEFLALGGDGKRAVNLLRQRAEGGGEGGSGVDFGKRTSKAAALAFFSKEVRSGGVDVNKNNDKEEGEEREEQEGEEGSENVTAETRTKKTKKKKTKSEGSGYRRSGETLYERYERIRAELMEVERIARASAEEEEEEEEGDEKEEEGRRRMGLGESRCGSKEVMERAAEVRRRLERLPQAIALEFQHHNVITTIATNANDVPSTSSTSTSSTSECVSTVTAAATTKEEEEEEEEEKSEGISGVLKAVRCLERSVGCVERSVGLPREWEGGSAGCVEMPRVDVLVRRLMSVTRAQTERLRTRIVRAQAALDNSTAATAALAPTRKGDGKSDEKSGTAAAAGSDGDGDNADTEAKIKGSEYGSSNCSSSGSGRFPEEEEGEGVVQHLHGQLEEWEKTMSALPVIAERLRSLCAVERRVRAAEGSVDKMLREQYCAQATLREVKEALFEVERRIAANKEAVEANIRYIESLISPRANSSQQQQQQQQEEQEQEKQQETEVEIATSNDKDKEEQEQEQEIAEEESNDQ